jgi:hypothetical protein
MVLRGNIGIRRYWFGVLPLHVGHLLKAGNFKNPKHLLPRTSLGFEYLKQGKYISGDERGGFNVGKVNLPLPDPRLRLFIQWKEDWLEEGLLVSARKNKRGRIVEEGSSSAQEVGAQQNYVPLYGGIPTLPSYYGGPSIQAWGSGAAMPPQSYVVPNVRKCGTTKCGHNRRICCKKDAKHRSHPIQRDSIR